MLERAREALTDEEYGADQWVKHQMKTLERLNQLIAVFDDPEVRMGARIRLDLDAVPLVRNGIEAQIMLPASRRRAVQ